MSVLSVDYFRKLIVVFDENQRKVMSFEQLDKLDTEDPQILFLTKHFA